MTGPALDVPHSPTTIARMTGRAHRYAATRHMISAALVVMAVALVLGPVARGAIIDADDRQRLPADLRGLFGGVGLIFSQATGDAGTGALVVRRDVVVTAAHLFFRPDGSPAAPLESWRFLVGDLVDGPFETFYVRALYTPSGRPFAADGENDIAILHLDRPLPTAIQPLDLPRRWGGLADYDGQAYLVGFHADRDQALAPQISPCRLRGRGVATWLYGGDHPLVYHDCDTAGHSSGAPLIVLEDGLPVLGAVHSAHRSDGDFRSYDAQTNYNFAVRIDDRVIGLIEALP